jgi:hypothetical protein
MHVHAGHLWTTAGPPGGAREAAGMNPTRRPAPARSAGVDDAAPMPSHRVRVTGCVAIDPALDAAELGFLAAFCESRRWDRPGGPYEVPANPLAECVDVTVDIAAFGRPTAGQPSLVCAWLPTGTGSALMPRPVVSCADEVVGWLRYLCDHFLVGDQAAARRVPGVPSFRPHTLAGAVAIADEATGSLDALVVRADGLTRVRLHPPVSGRLSA